MSRVGILSFSDGRDFVKEKLAGFVGDVEGRIAAACKGLGAEVVRGTEAVTSRELAVREARRMAAQRPDLTIFNFPVWAWPHFAVHAAKATVGPLLLFTNIDPAYPGMVGMLAAGGSLDQLGRRHERLWGDVEDPAVGVVWGAGPGSPRRGVTGGHDVRAHRREVHGHVHGRRPYRRVDAPLRHRRRRDRPVGGRPPRRGSACCRPSAGREWLEKYAAGVHYDGKGLTPEILERQVCSYYAVKEILEEGGITFCGIKGQPELTNHFATADIAEAFLNDPYDFEGPKSPVICATEDDMDGALTMQIMHNVTGTPVLFADVRHYFPERGHLGPGELGPACDLVRRPLRRPGREHGQGTSLPGGGVLLPGGRGGRPPHRRPRGHHPGPAVPSSTVGTACK